MEFVIARRQRRRSNLVQRDCFASLAMTAKGWSLADLGNPESDRIKVMKSRGTKELRKHLTLFRA